MDRASTSGGTRGESSGAPAEEPKYKKSLKQDDVSSYYELLDERSSKTQASAQNLRTNRSARTKYAGPGEEQASHPDQYIEPQKLRVLLLT